MKNTPIPQSAMHIVKTLQENGYQAVFAGGWVRDMLLEKPSEDVDIATDAKPETVMELFEKTIAVGVAFGVVVVVLGDEQFEVASFRKDAEYQDGRRPEKIEYTQAKEDALRRDFTINGMFFDPVKNLILDYVQGREDLDKGIIRAIGNADERFEEDRLRMLRAVRFSHRFHFPIEDSTKLAIKKHARSLLPSVSVERIWNELKGMINDGNFADAVLDLFDFTLLQTIFPILSELSREELQQEVEHIKAFPSETPEVLALMEVFSSLSMLEKEELMRYMKMSKKEMDVLKRYNNFLEKIDTPIEDRVYLYADELVENFLLLASSRFDSSSKEAFLNFHQMEREKHALSIERIRNRQAVLNAKALMEQGVEAGKKMGELLREGEKVSVANPNWDSEQIINYLKATKLWK